MIHYYISSSLNIYLSQDKHQCVLNKRVEDLNARDLALATVGKGSKNKIAKRKLDILGEIKAWSGLANTKDRIKRLKGQMKLIGELDDVIRTDKYQRSKKNGN